MDTWAVKDVVNKSTPPRFPSELSSADFSLKYKPADKVVSMYVSSLDQEILFDFQNNTVSTSIEGFTFDQFNVRVFGVNKIFFQDLNQQHYIEVPITNDALRFVFGTIERMRIDATAITATVPFRYGNSTYSNGTTLITNDAIRKVFINTTSYPSIRLINATEDEEITTDKIVDWDSAVTSIGTYTDADTIAQRLDDLEGETVDIYARATIGSYPYSGSTLVSRLDGLENVVGYPYVNDSINDRLTSLEAVTTVVDESARAAIGTFPYTKTTLDSRISTNYANIGLNTGDITLINLHLDTSDDRITTLETAETIDATARASISTGEYENAHTLDYRMTYQEVKTVVDTTARANITALDTRVTSLEDETIDTDARAAIGFPYSNPNSINWRLNRFEDYQTFDYSTNTLTMDYAVLKLLYTANVHTTFDSQLAKITLSSPSAAIRLYDGSGADTSFTYLGKNYLLFGGVSGTYEISDASQYFKDLDTAIENIGPDEDVRTWIGYGEDLGASDTLYDFILAQKPTLTTINESLDPWTFSATSLSHSEGTYAVTLSSTEGLECSSGTDRFAIFSSAGFGVGNSTTSPTELLECTMNRGLEMYDADHSAVYSLTKMEIEDTTGFPKYKSEITSVGVISDTSFTSTSSAYIKDGSVQSQFGAYRGTGEIKGIAEDDTAEFSVTDGTFTSTTTPSSLLLLSKAVSNQQASLNLESNHTSLITQFDTGNSFLRAYDNEASFGSLTNYASINGTTTPTDATFILAHFSTDNAITAVASTTESSLTVEDSSSSTTVIPDEIKVTNGTNYVTIVPTVMTATNSTGSNYGWLSSTNLSLTTVHNETVVTADEMTMSYDSQNEIVMGCDSDKAHITLTEGDYFLDATTVSYSGVPSLSLGTSSTNHIRSSMRSDISTTNYYPTLHLCYNSYTKWELVGGRNGNLEFWFWNGSSWAGKGYLNDTGTNKLLNFTGAHTCNPVSIPSELGTCLYLTGDICNLDTTLTTWEQIPVVKTSGTMKEFYGFYMEYIEGNTVEFKSGSFTTSVEKTDERIWVGAHGNMGVRCHAGTYTAGDTLVPDGAYVRKFEGDQFIIEAGRVINLLEGVPTIRCLESGVKISGDIIAIEM